MSMFCCSSSLKSIHDPTIIDISNVELLERIIKKEDIVQLVEPTIFERDVEIKAVVEPLVEESSIINSVIDTVTDIIGNIKEIEADTKEIEENKI